MVAVKNKLIERLHLTYQLAEVAEQILKKMLCSSFGQVTKVDEDDGPPQCTQPLQVVT